MRSKEKNMDLTSTENEAAKKAKKADKWTAPACMDCNGSLSGNKDTVPR